MGKRAFDVVVSGVLLVVLSPLLAVVSAAVRLALGPPVLFRQVRAGLHGRPFEIVKFRTMHPPVSPQRALLDDEERTPLLGLVLRSTSLDELPELWNVLRGDMSLVGPRPLLTDYLDHYTPEQARRHEVRPGLTGPAQVSGRNALPWDERFRLDVAYVQAHSLRTDLRLLLLTARQVLRLEDVRAAGQVRAARFLGSG